MKLDKRSYSLSGTRGLQAAFGIISLIGIILSVIAFVTDRSHFFHAWLVGFMFWFTLAAGGLFFVMLHHLIGSMWSVVIRRIAESVMALLPFMLIAFIPVAFGLHDLYHWTHEDAVANDNLLQWKEPYLNTAFFFIRVIVYFIIWTALTRMLCSTSYRQDSGHSEKLASRFRKISAPGMILFAATITFAAFDWLMSLDAHWYSTIFGVYIFSGAAVAILSFLPLVSILMRGQGVLTDTITVEHYHDMGKLLFAFLIFWGYMAFSQYFLIWYGNIPEETSWFLHRWEGSWKTVSLLLVFGNFVIPFFILITRGAKRSVPMLAVFAIWMLFMHWVDLYWIVMPGVYEHGAGLSWIDIAPMMAIGGAFWAGFWRIFSAHPAVTKGDPRLELSKHMVNY